MGIPSYFSQIIRAYPNILLRYADIINRRICFSRLYIDSNSILYDCYHKLPKNISEKELINTLIKNTIEKIEMYIDQIKPSKYAFIAFDGVAPLAKMEQQRTRRYKSWFETTVMNKISETDPGFTTSMFTPGTNFMNQLDKALCSHFYENSRVIVEGSTTYGEGEHKLYNHLRENPCNENEHIAIYGLDADLLMLSLVNLKNCNNMYVYREAPAFISVLVSTDANNKYDEDEPFFVDIEHLSRSIINEMACSDSSMGRIYDYVFLCFMLGNDFLPHFPSLNIRTRGIDILLSTYRTVLGKKKQKFLITEDNKIKWNHFSMLLDHLSRHEYEYVCQESVHRQKWNRKQPDIQPTKTISEKETYFLNVPVMFRKEEKYISPKDTIGWESRYYSALFNENINKNNICQNYLEGIEWVTQYYLDGNVQWKWKYNYHYPPLLKDLYSYFPNYSGLPNCNSRPVSSMIQLAYVLPPVYHNLLPNKIRNKLKKDYSHLYVNEIENMTFLWAYCRYFWESHVILPDICGDTIRKWEKMFL